MQHHNHTNSHRTHGLNRGTVVALLSTLGFFCAVTFFGIAQAMIPDSAPVAALDVAAPLADQLPELDITDDSGNEPAAETAEPAAETAPTEEPEAAAPRTNRVRRNNTDRRVSPTPTTPADDSNEQNSGGLQINIEDDPMADVETGGIFDV